ncbi:S-layer homology domain-containing protein [Paenibacillus xylaniclasticus]
MKKSLSLLVAIAMVFSMFASVAFAAEDAQPSTQDKFDTLKEKGIFEGFPDGSAGLDKNMTRAQFAKVLGLINNLTENAAASKYKDVPANHWAKGFIGAVTEAQLMNGVGANKFDPNGNVTIEALAKTLVLSKGLEPVEGATVAGTSAWAAGYVQAALDAGLIPALSNYKVAATRAQLVEATYTYVVGAVDNSVLKITKAAQTGAKKITIEFSKAVDKNIAIDAKYLAQSLSVTKTFAEDLKSVVLEAGYLPAGDVVVKVGDLEEVTVKAEAEKASKIVIEAESLQKAANQKLGVKKLNQFGEETSVGQTVYTRVFNSTKSKDLTSLVNDDKIDLSHDDNAKIDDVIVVTATSADALNEAKSFKVTAASSATKIKLGAPVPLKDKTRITVGEEGIVLPIELTDQFGKSVTLATYGPWTPQNGQFELSGIKFYVGQDGEIDQIKVDDKGVVTFTAKKAGTVVLTASNPATGAYDAVSFKIEDAVKVKELKLNAPASLVVQKEKVVVPYTAVDQFGNVIAPKDVKLDNVKIHSTVDATYKLNGKGELEFTFSGKGTTLLQAFVDNALTSSVTFEVREEATIKSVKGLKDVLTTLENGASVTIAEKNIEVVDNYGRVKTLDALSVTGKTYSITASGSFKYENGKLNAISVGTGKLTIEYSDSKVSGLKSSEISLTSVKHEDIKSYEIKSIGTIYGNKDNVSGGKYSKTVELNGKTSGGTSVALKNTAPEFVTSSDETIVKADTVNNAVYGLKAGTATVVAYLDGDKVAEAEVTASDAAPVAATAKFVDKDEYSLAKGATVTLTVEVKDQYGVVIEPAGLLTTKDTAVVSIVKVDNKTFKVTGNEKGYATVTYISSNNTTVTATIVVD